MKGGIKVELEKLYGARAVTAAAPARRPAIKEDTSDAFARMLQNLRTSKAANSRDRADDEGDTVITRVLADGSVIVRVYKGTALISETMTRGSDPAAGKRTLAVRLGAGRARAAFIAMLWAPVAAGVVAVVWAHRALGGSGTVWLVALAVVIAVLGAAATRAGGTVLAGATGRALIPALRDAGLYELLYGVALAAALVLASR